MSVLYFLVIVLFFNVAALKLFEKKVFPIIIELLVAVILVPIVSYVFLNYGNVNITKSIAENGYVSHFYKLNFALMIGYILLDCIGNNIEKEMIKVASCSFLLPFISGVIFSYIYLEHFSYLSAVSFGVLFSITAVPVLHMILKNLDYTHTDIKRLVQVAIIIDVLSWLTFSVTKDYKVLMNNIPVIILGLIPLLLQFLFKKINTNSKNCSYIYGVIFFLTILLCEYNKWNIILFGLIYVMCCAYLKQKVEIPINHKSSETYQKWIAIPFILTVGMSQVNIAILTKTFSCADIGLLLLPIVCKILGNYIGLYLACDKPNRKNIKNILRESVLLNTRGLTEIIFLNMLFSEKIISEKIYVIVMIMGLLSTLLPLCIKHNKE